MFRHIRRNLVDQVPLPLHIIVVGGAPGMDRNLEGREKVMAVT